MTNREFRERIQAFLRKQRGLDDPKVEKKPPQSEKPKFKLNIRRSKAG